MDDEDNDSTVSSSCSSTGDFEEVALTEKELENLIQLFKKDIHRNYGIFISLNRRKKKNQVQSIKNKRCYIDQQQNINLTVNNNKSITKPTDIPKYSNQFFGRDKETERIFKILTETKLAIVTGIEGIGKTEFAKHFVDEYYEKFEGIEWINGATKDKFNQSIAYITHKHNIDNNTKDFVQYFGTKNFLFVIDNAYENIHYRHYFPKSSNIFVLMTTASPDSKQKKHLYRLSKLTNDETIDILNSIFLDFFSTSDEYDWQIFSNFFENIPLALQLSGSCLFEQMMKNDGLRVENYFEDLKLKKKNYSLENNSSLSDEYNKIYMSFKVSLETMLSSEKQSQLALDVLNTCVYLDDDYISNQVLLGHEKVESKQNLDAILELLRRYRLVSIEIKQNSNEVHIHSLIRKMLLLEQEKDGTSEKYFKMALGLLCIMGVYNLQYFLYFAAKFIKIFVKFLFDNELFDILDPIVQNGHDKILNQILKVLPNPAATINNKDLLFKAIDSEQAKSVKVLLKYGASANRVTTKLRGPLHKASKKLMVPIIVLLLEAGANPNWEDYKKNTPMHSVVGIGYQNNPDEGRTVQCIRALMKHGANINEENIEGDTPLDLALENKAFKVALFLLDNIPVKVRIIYKKTIKRILSWDICSDNEESNAHKVIKSLLLKGAKRSAIDSEGKNLLIWAVENKCERIIQFLLDECSFDVNYKDNSGQTALHKILGQTITTKKQAHSTVSIVRTLLDHNAKTDIEDNDGRTASDVCIDNGNVKLCLFIQFLMDELPDLTKKKTYYYTKKNLTKPETKSNSWESEHEYTDPYRGSVSSQMISPVSQRMNYAAASGYLSNMNTAASLYRPTNYLPGPSYNNLLN